MAMNYQRETIVLKNVGLVFRNFSGEARQYNNAGDRNFNVKLSQEQANDLRKRGFNVRTVGPNERYDEPEYLMKVKVSYRFDAPNVNLISSRCTRRIDEATIGELDHVAVEKCDISIVGSNWVQPNGDHGVTAYLRSMYLTLREDPLDLEYAAMGYEETEEDPF